MRTLVAAACMFALGACAGEGSTAAKDKAVAVGIMTDMTAAMNDMAQRHEVDLEAGPPAGWRSVEYSAGASSRIDVPRYFRNYLAYVGELETRLGPVADSIIDERFRRAGFKESTEKELKAAFKRGFERTAQNRQAMYAAMRRYAEAALKLHEFLASVDERALPGVGDNVEFEKVEEQMQFGILLGHMERTEDYLSKVQERQQAALAASLKEAGAKPSDLP
jgi:hypothetical protein